MIKIDFENTYEPQEAASDLSFLTFYTEIKKDSPLLIKIKIQPLGFSLLPNVYNLSFGPIMDNGDIDDAAKLNHANKDKVFSTILLFCLAYLQSNPSITIGLDGSNDVRADLYRYYMFHLQEKNSI